MSTPFPTNSNAPAAQSSPHGFHQRERRPPTPPPPSYSPITPEFSSAIPANLPDPTSIASSQNFYAQLDGSRDPYHSTFSQSTHPLSDQEPASIDAPTPSSSMQTAQPPPPAPLSMETNADAIALRAAMSILQLQRQRAISDMQVLEEQKKIALADPEAFARAVQSGRVKSRGTEGLGGVGGSISEDEDEEDQDEADGHASAQSSKAEMREESTSTTMTDAPPVSSISSSYPQELTHSHPHTEPAPQPVPPSSKFPAMTIPAPQNVVRMPHINWSQYHIVGESLDKLHREQLIRPVGGVPEGSTETGDSRLWDGTTGGRKEAVIAAPYDPFVDVIEDQSKEKEKSKRAGAVHGTAVGASSTPGESEAGTAEATPKVDVKKKGGSSGRKG